MPTSGDILRVKCRYLDIIDKHQFASLLRVGIDGYVFISALCFLFTLLFPEESIGSWVGMTGDL